MSDHQITFEEWTRCQEALARLTGGVAALISVRDAVREGELFSRAKTADGLYFLAQSINREIDTLKDLLGYAESKPRFELRDAAEAVMRTQ